MFAILHEEIGMIRSISTVIDDPDKGQAFLCELLERARAADIYTYLTLMTPAPMLSTRIAPFGGLYIPEAELRSDALAAIASIRAAAGADYDRLLVKGIYGDVSWLAHDLRNDDDIADLALIGPEETWNVPWLRRQSIETLLLASGTPLMLLPQGRTLPALRHIVLGWKPSAQAVHAARAIVALADPAARIEIVTVGAAPAESDRGPKARCGVGDYLRRHGLEATCHWIEGADCEATALQDFAIERGADVLAIGGFGHSRVREIVLGGVTRDLIGHCRLPALLAH